MATSDKNIVITPNISSSTDDPKIVFSGADASTGAQNITMKVYPTNSGTLSFEGSAGQLFSIVNSLSGTIFAVSDVSGIPSIEVLDSGLVKINQYNGDTNIGGVLGTSGTRLTVKGYSDSWNTTTPGTTKGTIHIDIYGSSGSTDGGAITFSAKDSTNPAQAGIYVTSSGSFGTRMYLATTDSYATGSKTAVSISETGVVNFPRARPTYAGTNVALVNDTTYIGTTSVALNRSSASLSLTGVSIDGSAGSVTNGFYTTSSFYLGTTSIAVNRSSASQSLTGVSIDGSAGTANALNTGNDYQVNTIAAGGAKIGQAGLTINGTSGNNDSQLIIKKPSQSAYAILAWDDAIYFSYNVYYVDGSWTHSGPSNNNSLFVFSSGGALWYASNNGSGSWNVVSSQTLWNQNGHWAAPVVGSAIAKMLVFGR